MATPDAAEEAGRRQTGKSAERSATLLAQAEARGDRLQATVVNLESQVQTMDLMVAKMKERLAGKGKKRGGRAAGC